MSGDKFDVHEFLQISIFCFLAFLKSLKLRTRARTKLRAVTNLVSTG